MQVKHIKALLHFGTLFLYLKPKENHTSQNLHPNNDILLNTVLLYSTKHLSGDTNFMPDVLWGRHQS